MKPSGGWRISKQFLPVHCNRHISKRPVWIILLICLVPFLLICGFVFAPQSAFSCYLFSSRGCGAVAYWNPSSFERVYTEEELAFFAVVEEILRTQPPTTSSPKIAFLFLTPGKLPFEMLWDKFFDGHEGKFNVYVHASEHKPVHKSRYFVDRDIHSEKVAWGEASMTDAERRLLVNALKDPDNHHFVLLSDSCIPLHKFDYIYNYLIYTNISYVDSFVDPGRHGNDRYSPYLMPEIQLTDFRKGSQWFSMKRQHALMVIADSLYYSKFRKYCTPHWRTRSCYCDEHYLPTFFTIVDPGGIANRSITYVDWSERKSHPRSYRVENVSYELLQNITSIDVAVHETSEEKSQITTKPCLWNGARSPCYLFARKFHAETLDKLMHLFSYNTSI